MRFPGFCGPTAQAASLNVNAERTLNWCLEMTRSGTPKSDPINTRTPGIEPYVIFPEGPVRGLFHQDGRCFGVGADTLYEILGENNYVNRGVVGVDADPAYMAYNGVQGRQLIIGSVNLGYIFDTQTNTLTQITDAEFPTAVDGVEFVDGYFVVLNGTNNSIHFSDPFDGFLWDGTQVAQRSMTGDDVFQIRVSHRDIWWFGSEKTEVWYNSGDPDFPFEPSQSAGVIETGLMAHHSVVRIDNALMWLGRDERGGVVAYRADGYVPKRISTHAVEEAWRHYADMRTAIGYAYLEGGHQFYVLYLPDGPDPSTGQPHTHWVYDCSLPPEIGWSQRSIWNPNTCLDEPHRGRCHAFARLGGEDVHLVGDHSTGAVYRQSLDILEDTIVQVAA